MLLEQSEQLGVLDARHLHDLSGAVAQVALRQGPQEARVQKYRQRRAVRAHLIFLAVEATSTQGLSQPGRSRLNLSSPTIGAGSAKSLHPSLILKGRVCTPKLYETICWV